MESDLEFLRTKTTARNAAIYELYKSGIDTSVICRVSDLTSVSVRGIISRCENILYRHKNPDAAPEFDGLSARAINCLKLEGINTKEQLANLIIEKGEVHLLRVPNLGRVSINEIISFIAPYMNEVALAAEIDDSISLLEGNGFIVVKSNHS